MARYSILLGARTALLLLLSVMFVKGVPLRDNRLSTIVDDVARRIFNETGNELFSGVIDRHLACRACKQLIINSRFALIIEKTTISEYFTDPCNDFFTDDTDRKNCKLVIQLKVDKIYTDIFDFLNAQHLCKDTIHLCPGKAKDDAVDNEIRDDILGLTY